MLHKLYTDLSWGQVLAIGAGLYLLYFLIVKQGMISFGEPRDCNCPGEKPKGRTTKLPGLPEPPPERLIRR